MKRPPALMFGVPIADVSMAETLELIGELVADGRSTGRTHQIATTNVDFLVNALDTPDLRAILQRADACLADGMPVVWGVRLLGMPIEERVAGADLVPQLVAAAATTGWRIHIFGSSESVAERASAIFAARCPGAMVSIDPGPRISDPTSVDASVIEAIREVDADILCVALGNPKQEWFIDANRERLGVPVMIGVGGSLDLLVGEKRRAPTWMQRSGTEWIARLVQEPRRLGTRYARDAAVFGPRLLGEWRATRIRRHDPDLLIDVAPASVTARIGEPPGPSPDGWSRAVERLRAGASLRLSAGAATSIRDSALAALIGLVREARRLQAQVTWVDDPSALRRSVEDRNVPAELVGMPPGSTTTPAGS